MSIKQKNKVNLLKFQKELNQQFLEIFNQKKSEQDFLESNIDFLGISVQVSDFNFFIPLSKLKSIALNNDVENIIQTKSWVVGFNQDRGEVYTVLNLIKILELILKNKTDFEKANIKNISRIVYLKDIDKNKFALLLNEVKLDYTAEFTLLIKHDKKEYDFSWYIEEGLDFDIFVDESKMSKNEWDLLIELRKNVLMNEVINNNDFKEDNKINLLASFIENVYLDTMGRRPIFVLNIDRLFNYLNTKVPF